MKLNQVLVSSICLGFEVKEENERRLCSFDADFVSIHLISRPLFDDLHISI